MNDFHEYSTFPASEGPAHRSLNMASLLDAPTGAFAGSGASIFAPDALRYEAKETPAAAMYKEIIRVQRMIDSPSSALSDPEVDAAADLLSVLSDEIIELHSESPMDFIYKLLGHTMNAEHCLCCSPSGSKLWGEARAFVCRET